VVPCFVAWSCLSNAAKELMERRSRKLAEDTTFQGIGNVSSMSFGGEFRSTRGMILRSLIARNFRSLYHVEIPFQPDVTVVVGENNSGKSNLIDALRLVLSPHHGRRSRFFEPEDVSFGREGEAIERTSRYLTSTSRYPGAGVINCRSNRTCSCVSTSSVPTQDRCQKERVRPGGRYDGASRRVLARRRRRGSW
jgi:hypothetical protein